MSILPPSPRTNQTNEPDLKPREFRSFTTSLPCSTHPYTQHNTMLQDQLKFDFSANHSHHLDSLWDSNTSPQSTLSSTLSSIQGSPEGSSSSSSSSSQEPSPTSQDFCWESTYDTMEMLEKMKLDERDSSEYHYGYVNQRLEASNVGLYSLLQEQIRSIQLSWTRQEEILSQKQDPTAYGGENQGQISQQFQKKAKGVNVGCDYGRRISPPLQHARSHQQTGSYSGTGVFFPRGETSAPFGSCKRPDVLVSNRDGMYSLQNRQSQNQLPCIQNEMVLPQEWTY